MDPHHLGVPSGAPKKISLHVVHSAQTVHLSFAEINTFSKQTQMSFHLTHVTEEFDQVHLSCIEINTISKMISEPMIHLAQTVHQYYVEISTISKLTEMSFQLTHVM
jgi:hypothetical protein